MSDYVKLVGVVKRALNEIPEDYKNAAPAALSSATSLLESGVIYAEKHQSLQSLQGFLTTTNSTTAANATQILDQCAPKFPELVPHRDACISLAQSPEVASSEITDCVGGCMQKCADQALLFGFALSVIGLAFEAWRLHGFWEEIRNANLFVKTDFDRMKAIIQEKVDQLPQTIQTFGDGLEESNFIGKSGDERVLFVIRKNRQRDAVVKIIKGIQEDIGELKCEVNGRIESLGSYRRAAYAPAIAHTVQSLTLGINLAVFGAVASPVLVTLTGFAVALNIATAGTGLYFKHRAGLTVEELRKKLREVEELRKEVDRQQDRLTLMFEEFEDTMAALSKK